MKVLIVSKKFNNKKLSNFLLNSIDGLTSSTFYKLLRKKDIRINGKRINENCIVKLNDEIQVYISDKALQKLPLFSIIYEDDNILVANKPIGVTVSEEENSLTSSLKQTYSFIEPCHRLDRNTSGLVLFAKNSTSLEILLEKFKFREIKKHYVCICLGLFQKKEDLLTAYLFKDSQKGIVYIKDSPQKGYKKIVTGYKVMKQFKEKNLSLLDIELQTGRTHQIRAHLAHIGHPILGDGKYGNGEVNRKFSQKVQCLCSYSLTFSFSSESYHLEYLKGKEIHIPFPNYFADIV